MRPLQTPSRRGIRLVAALAAFIGGCVLNWDPLLPTNPSGCGTLGMPCCSTDAAPAECITGLACNAGTCGCGTGFAMCGSACVDTMTSSANCGACGNACNGMQVCVGGSCTMGCTGGTTICGTNCVDLTRDTANCGACGTACGTGEACRNSHCM